MSPQEALAELAAKGFTQTEIAEMVTCSGVTTTQETISRIASGKFKTTNFDLGCAIVNLLKEQAA